ncbi:MAG TPA: response regulator transcription factor [Candidatus Acidoferrales bacterium]|nr:response regulator transcription factor [Candidatus Acidoferrales bacterium]
MGIRVLLADDTQMMRQAIRRLLADHAEVEVVGEAENLVQTLQMMDALRPQVTVMDLHLPNFGYLDVKSHLNGTQLLAISLSNDEEARLLAESLGAAKLLDKMELYNELIPAIMQLGSPNEGAASA